MPQTRRFFARALLGLTALFLAPLSYAQLTAADIIKHGERPDGVVFEIIEGKESDLAWALEQIRDDARELRKKFPGLAIAVVSHGREQFALTSGNAKAFNNIHSLGQSLVENEDIPVHVCATHASWYDVAPEDFPDFVDVAPTGPGQIRQYEDLGYSLIVVERR